MDIIACMLRQFICCMGYIYSNINICVEILGLGSLFRLCLVCLGSMFFFVRLWFDFGIVCFWGHHKILSISRHTK